MSIEALRWCGWLLVMGMVVFMVGGAFWRADFQAPSLADTLRSVVTHRTKWLWIHAWIACGVVVTVAGLSGWDQVQRQSAGALATHVGLVLYVVGATLWLVAIGMRVTVQDWAAAEAVKGQIPPGYPPLHRLMAVFHGAHMVLSYAAAAALGVGVLQAGIPSARLGWVGVIAGPLFALGFVLARGGPFGPPFLAHAFTCALGVLLVRWH